MKKVTYLLVAVLMISMIFGGCAGTGEEPVDTTAAPAETTAAPAETTAAPAETTAAPEDTEVTTAAPADPYPGAVGKTATLVLKDLTNPAWLMAKDGAVAAAADFGMDLEVVAPVESNNNDEQIQLVQQAIAQKKDILVMVPSDSTGIVPAIAECDANGLPVINLNTKINNESGTAPSETFVVADNIMCATLCATELAARAGEKGEILILQGPSGGQVTIDLTKGAEDTFAKFPDMEVVDIKDANFDRTTGYQVTQNMLQTYPELAVIFSCNDEMALGALQAVEEAGLKDQIVIGGIDGNNDALNSIKDGRLDVTVYKNFWLQAYTAVEAAAKFLNGDTLPELIPVDLTAVTKDNVDEFLK